MPQFIMRTFHKFQLTFGGMQYSKFALQVECEIKEIPEDQIDLYIVFYNQSETRLQQRFLERSKSSIQTYGWGKETTIEEEENQR